MIELLKKFFLNLYFWPMFLLITIIGLLNIPLIRALNFFVFKLDEPTLFRKGIRVYGWFIVKLIPFFRPVRCLDLSGGLPEAGILVVNHLSAADPYCFGVLPGEYAFMTSWPFSIPVYSGMMKKAQYINSRHGWLNILNQGCELLQRGCSLIIWPEGHRSRNGALQEFQNGAFRMARETGYPIVPVCITGTDKLLPPGRRLLSPAEVVLSILPPLYPQQSESPRQDVQDLKNRVRECLARELACRQGAHA